MLTIISLLSRFPLIIIALLILVLGACVEEPDLYSTKSLTGTKLFEASTNATRDPKWDGLTTPPRDGSRIRELSADQPTITQSFVTQEVIIPSPSSRATLVPEIISTHISGTEINPLTGLKVEEPALLNRRPLAIKVANTARVRPQAGLNAADLIFEHYTEGGITRFTAIYYSNTPRRVGSIRSARLIDLEIPIMYDAAFAYSGSSYQIREMIRYSLFTDRVISPDFGDGGFWRTLDELNPSRYQVDSMFTDTIVLRQMLNERGQEQAPLLRNGMVFDPVPPKNGSQIRGVEINYKGTGVYWEYRAADGRFYRWSDGQEHLDAVTSEFVNFKNIIIVWAPHLDTQIIEDSAGSPSIQIQIWGEGPADIFRDGFHYKGVWKRDHPLDMLTFYDLEGVPLPLAPGNSFFELVPLDFEGLFPID